MRLRRTVPAIEHDRASVLSAAAAARKPAEPVVPLVPLNVVNCHGALLWPCMVPGDLFHVRRA